METSLGWLDRLATAPSNTDWQRLMDAYAPLLGLWLVRTGVPSVDCDDIVQDVLIVVVRQVQSFEHRGPGAFRAWLRGILTNRVRKFFRDRPAAPACNLDLLACDDSELSRLWDREHDEYLTAAMLKAAEPDFAPLDWQAFRLQTLGQAKPADVARDLGMSLNSVFLAKSRILKRLRADLHGFVDD